MKSAILCGLIAAVMAPPAFSQWAQEPLSVFGITLGQPLAIGAFAPCIEGNATNGHRGSTGPCVVDRPYKMPILQLKNFDLPKGYSAALGFYEGDVISGIHLGFKHGDYEAMKALMIERYGPPHSVEASIATTRMNLSVSNETLLWKGSTNTIMLRERNDTIDQSLMAFTNNEAMAKAQARRDAKAKADASKF